MRIATAEDAFLAAALRASADGAATLPRATGRDTDDTGCFAPAVAPLLAAAADRLRAATPGLAPDVTAAAHDALLRTLRRQLTRTAARTLVFELHASGDGFDEFVAGVAAPAGLRRLFGEYPVLADRLARTCLNGADAIAELAMRLDADRDALAALLPAGAGTTVREVQPGSGDVHRGGRTVAMVRLDGGTVVYKPRSLAAAEHVGRFFALLSDRRPDLALRTPRVIVRDGYGWEEFVGPHPCADDAALLRFYLRHGALLALMYLLDATDLHCQNVVAHGEHPVVVDAETLFHPTLAGDDLAADPAAADHLDSVVRTGLLPLLVRGEHGIADLSGLCGGRPVGTVEDVVRFRDPGTSRMRLVRERGEIPAAGNLALSLDGRPCAPDAAHAGAVLAGFRAAYNELMACRDELAALVRDCAEDEVRVVLRPTQLYATLLDELTHPELLRDPDRYDDALRSIRNDDDHPVLQALADVETDDLRDGDVPLFVTRAGSRTLTGHRPGAAATLPDSGVQRVLGRIAAAGTAGLQRQLWYVEAGFAGRGQELEHRAAPRTGCGTGPRPVEAERLLAQACAIGDELLSASRGSVTGRVNWVGIEPADGRHWELKPMGAGLADGYTGVAVFLADLGHATGIERYLGHASAALTALGPLFERLAADPDLARAASDDPLAGLAGVHAALTHLADRLDDRRLPAWRDACAAVRATLPAVTSPVTGADVTWCHGVPQLLRGPERRDEILAAVRAAGPLEQHSLCHGELGVLETLRLACPPGTDPDPDVDLLRRERLTAFAGELETRGARSGTVGAVRTPGLLHGLAGIGLALVNQAFAHTTRDVRAPSFDLLRAVRPEFATAPLEETP